MLIPVTIDIRDLDPDAGPAPIGARVAFARLSPTTSSGVLVTTDPVLVDLDTTGHGATQLRSTTEYWVHCYGFNGFGGSFAIRTGDQPASLGELWRTAQIDPGGFAETPVPETVADALAEIRLLLEEALAGGGNGGSFTDNGDGTWSTTSTVTDNGDGTFTV